jgi:hypothetical protein
MWWEGLTDQTPSNLSDWRSTGSPMLLARGIPDARLPSEPLSAG